jgi:hypothetical protein
MQLPPVRPFTQRYPSIVRELLTSVFVGEPFEEVLDPAKRPTPGQFIALWDTGATNCMVTDRVVETCGLKPITMTAVAGCHGSKDCDVFLVSIWLPNKIVLPIIQVTGGAVIPGADILLGMDIISLCDFAITNFNRSTVLTFRLPSIADIDFERLSPATGKELGRNDPCYCGSGKKYKKCHGKSN